MMLRGVTIRLRNPSRVEIACGDGSEGCIIVKLVDGEPARLVRGEQMTVWVDSLGQFWRKKPTKLRRARRWFELLMKRSERRPPTTKRLVFEGIEGGSAIDGSARWVRRYLDGTEDSEPLCTLCLRGHSNCQCVVNGQR